MLGIWVLTPEGILAKLEIRQPIFGGKFQEFGISERK
jgi:hypothetical protein